MFSPSLFALLALAANEPAVRLSGSLADREGQPVAGATVVVAEGPPATRIPMRAARQAVPKAADMLGMGTTDGSGQFHITFAAEKLPWRRSRLAVWSYQPSGALSVRLIDHDWPTAELPLPLTLAPAASVRLKFTGEDWRSLATLKLVPLRVAGQLLPENLAERLSTTTDDAGRAVLPGIAPGDLDLVRVEGDAVGKQWIGVPARGREQIIVLRLAPVGRLIGRLTADDPRAVKQRKLHFATWQIPGDTDAGGGLAQATTDDEGNFEVPALATGSLTFTLEPGGEPDYLTSQTSATQVDAHETSTCEIALRRAVAVTQEVRDQDDDSPLAGVRILISGYRHDEASSDTNESGVAHFHLLPGKKFSMPVRTPAAYYSPDPHFAQDVGLATAPVSLKILRLVRGETVRGRVIDDLERPVAGAEVLGFFNLAPQQKDYPVRAWSNASGEFTIEGVAPHAPVRLWVSHGAEISVKPTLARGAGQPVTLILREAEGVVLEGRVVDAAGQPIAGASVRIWPEQRQDIADLSGIDFGCLLFDGQDRLLTDADGNFRTPRRVRPNAWYSLSVDAPGMLHAETEAIEPESWATARFADVQLRRAPRLRTVSGTVVDRQLKPVAGAEVWQAGDGPRRTQAITDEEGRFQLTGLYDRPALLLARKEGFRLHGVRVAAEEKTCRLVLPRDDDPKRPMQSLPPLVPLEEQHRLAISLVEPLLPMLRDQVYTVEHRWLMNVVAQNDPELALKICETTLLDEFSFSVTRSRLARVLIKTNWEKAMAIIAGMDAGASRAAAYQFAWDELGDAPSDRRNELLDAALSEVRAADKGAVSLRNLASIAVRWLSVGEVERGTAVLREGQALAERLPAPNEQNQGDFSVGLRCEFAGSLARIDGPAAMRLVEGYTDPHRRWFLARIAVGLAGHDVVEAQRVLEMISSPDERDVVRVIERMATKDPDRAAQLARERAEPDDQAAALGVVAGRLAERDHTEALRLLEEAFALFERAHELDPAREGGQRTATLAAGLLRVVEKIDPALVESYLWRVLALRGPRAAQTDSSWDDVRHFAPLATLIARYDREVARDLLTPLASRLREALASDETNPGHVARFLLMGLAITDAHWAAEVVRSLPDAAVAPRLDPKYTAGRLLGEWLGSSPRETWRIVYAYCGMRDPDAALIDD